MTSAAPTLPGLPELTIDDCRSTIPARRGRGATPQRVLTLRSAKRRRALTFRYRPLKHWQASRTSTECGAPSPESRDPNPD